MRLCPRSLWLFLKSLNTMSPFFVAIFLFGLCLANAINFTSVYEWDQLDFVWPSNKNGSIGQLEQYFNSSEVYFRYMAVFEERLFLSLDINLGIPATLVWLPTSDTSTAPPKLAPFPSWDLHKYHICDSIQWAKGMQVDTEGRLWVIDEGDSACPSKLWIFDLANNDTTERVHQFPETLVSHYYKKRFLSELVLDKTPDDYLAYFADYQSEYLIVYSLKTNKSGPIKTPGVKWQSLAVSPLNREARQLWYIIRRSDAKELYSVSVSELKKAGESAVVKLIGAWPGMPYKMVIDSANVLYAGVFNKNYLSKWNISEPFLEQRFHEVATLRAEWPFSLALDANDTLWVMERNESGVNNKHRLLNAAVGARSYLFNQSTALPTL
ncbi:Hypothetical predicted protein [Cloeon dipterum]|uniref:Bee-milk protein n=1 Tax=Cloeon dipterum TaxID=197152 RepID=A0A8S1DQJ5_9INSE|nr:Hypothetical predicted protein [Cloeon dipterum]